MACPARPGYGGLATSGDLVDTIDRQRGPAEQPRRDPTGAGPIDDAGGNALPRPRRMRADETGVDRWPLPVRAAIFLGGGAALWTLIVLVLRQL